MQKKHVNPDETWVCDNTLIVEAEDDLTEAEVLRRMTQAMRDRVGDAALVDCHRIGPTKYRVIVYARQAGSF